MMSKNLEPTSTETADAAGDSHKPFIVLCIAVLCLWIALTLAMCWLLPDWQTRGTAGDSFGAVNALFSGLAFAGLIYALALQRKELSYQREEMLATRKVSEAQLAEMKASRELLAQPLAIPAVDALRIERPRFFYSPPEDEYSAQARYFISIALSNPTQYPAIGSNVRCRIQLAEPVTQFGATDFSFAILAPGVSLNEKSNCPDFLFCGDNSGLVFESLRQHDPRKVPLIVVAIIFKNVVGAHFRLVQAFRVYAGSEHAETLRGWHTAIVGFGARYKHELAQLRELRRKRKDDEWQQLFDRIKAEFAAAVLGHDEIQLRTAAVPASFSLEVISEEEYRKNLATASYSQIITGLYDCPAELDSRK